MPLKPWREIAVPHPDVLEGTFQQSEFAADITAVHSGKATREYQDAAAFFERTFITEGMRLLLTQFFLDLVPATLDSAVLFANPLSLLTVANDKSLRVSFIGFRV